MGEEKVFSQSWAYAIERDLSHILSDAGTFNLSREEMANRVTIVRDRIRLAMRSAGYKGLLF